MKTALIGASILPVVVTAISMFFLPDTVAFHFGANGEPDSWSEKPVLFVGSSILSVCLLIFISCYLAQEKQKKTGVEFLVLNGTIPLWGCWSLLIPFNIINIVPILFNLNLIGTISIGPFLVALFLILAAGTFAFGIQYIRGKWLNRSNSGIEPGTEIKSDSYWSVVTKVIGIFLIILAAVFLALAIAIGLQLF